MVASTNLCDFILLGNLSSRTGFYLSFTNKRFASDQAVEMVGFQNYRDLLSVTVRELPKKLDENGQPIFKRW
ncbi:MAG: hypothetical protein R2865_17575 [Deinococcales bacterium]